VLLMVQVVTPRFPSRYPFRPPG